MAKIIDGKMMAEGILETVRQDVDDFRWRCGISPTLAVILVGDDPASHVYVSRKLKASKRVGIASIERRLPCETTQDALLAEIDALNMDPAVHGILVQLPLPRHIDAAVVLDRISPSKDVDGFHPVNVGRLSTGTHGLIPCTPLGCLLLLESVVKDFCGLKAVVIGKSNIVGKPVALLLLERECTVTVTHINTRNLPSIVSTADIVVVAAGSPGLVRGGWVKPGAIVIDIGINKIVDKDGRSMIVGDAVTSELDHAAAVTPVPGGVGPMTIACLLSNTVRAANMMTAGSSPNAQETITIPRVA
ncbi:bifunctional 5,10-methylenetetrahydrofolate dehydrogenase/5,10-methenyltetrahydrofolate cyclohydrolase [Sphingobium sp. Cam5-1]|uniref:bifunctional 5,10-methylenetetrahydrofolate dehydrogenase/5,10-methenyltetrahydrofolate cyclohydrolase n=1 Tax=Sphingobium sp. Cam5-1 TaxID=2789327 RepID=UPI0018AD2769|nr:tetrahydrofolate dehydrogenase/cyclohydrolase catalytic domain-containing protein [Sphingobium sp. Cam5-1]QPI75144.1 bifunctional methylenetetrahydrofolate dehydrogenase/methenyltetrahydrofolate cyclohydrolase [Sphingobium sp. Cam5-1]